MANKQPQKINEYNNSVKTGNIDALVVSNQKSLRVYTDNTSDKTYRILIEKMNEGAVTLNEDGTILYCNASFAKMIKLPLQKVIGTMFKDLIDPSSRAWFEGLLKKRRVTDIKEEVYMHSDNVKAIPVLMSVNKFLIDNIIVLSIVLTNLTILNKNQEELRQRSKELEQKNVDLGSLNIKLAIQIDENLKRAEERKKDEEHIGLLASIVESSDDAIISKSLDGIIKIWNKGSEKMFGYTSEEAVGKHITLIIPAEYIIEENEIIKRIRNNETIHYETIRNKKNGKQFNVSITVSPLKDLAGNIVGASKIARDISSRKKAEKRLIEVNKELVFQIREREKRETDLILLSKNLKTQQSGLRNANDELHKNEQLLLRQDEKMIRINDELLSLNQNLEKKVLERTRELENLNHKLKDLNVSKDKFLSVISHDLRNPLAALLVSSDELSNGVANHNFKDIQTFAKIINGTSQNLFKQLNELVEWALMQKEKTILNKEKIPLNQGVHQSLELLKEIATQKNIILENRVALDIYVNANTLMLRSILQNLVTNSIKYTLQKGLITISARAIANRMIEIAVSDSGIGMETSTKQHLFSESKSASVSGTNHEKGNGLGLILVKDFVTQHRGTIHVESELGKGTSVIFTMPVYNEEEN